MSFAALKNQSQSNFATLAKELEKISNPESSSGGADDRLWKPTLDKSGNGFAVIRFLPASEGEDLPWAKVWSHAFQGTGGWLIDNCLTTINQKCPVCEHNSQLWNSGIESNKEIVRKQKRKLSYYANIFVLQDPANPENEGKVFLYKFGKKIFDKIMEAMQPAFADETPINPFDFWQGADFKLKIRKVDGYWNYDKSEFANPGTLGNQPDEILEKIWKKQYSLTEFSDPTTFKSYNELKARLDTVLGAAPARVDRETQEIEEDNWNDSRPISSYSPKFEEPTPVKQTSNFSTSYRDEEDDDLSFFARLAEED